MKGYGKKGKGGKGKGKGCVALVVLATSVLGGCSYLNLNKNSTVAECEEQATALVVMACERLGDVRDKSQAFVTTVKGAVEASK
jgi:hypothetical protein